MPLGTDAAGLLLTIDLGALADNWRRLASLSAPAECAAVVKADAYGIGIEAAVPALWRAGCRTFFVALPDEGRRVRVAAPEAAIYVLDGFVADWTPAFVEASLRPVLSTVASISAWADAAPGSPSAIQVDTGMNRLGLSAKEASDLAARPDLLSRIAPEILISHLAAADDERHPANAMQRERLIGIAGAFPDLPLSFANSAGIHLGRSFHFDQVRPGIALYGGEFSRQLPPLRPVATAEARILQIRSAGEGETVGYGAAHRLSRPARIAVLAAGYADGYHRRAGWSDERSGAKVFLRGRSAPLVGRVSMDLIAVDVTEIEDAAEGDWVELFGPNMPLDDVARAGDTIGYELLTQLSRRAGRRYRDAAGER